MVYSTTYRKKALKRKNPRRSRHHFQRRDSFMSVLNHLRILSYQPNLVSRKFGISQTIPRPFYQKKSKLCLNIIDYSEDDYLQKLTKHADLRPTLSLFGFEPTDYFTQDFDTWWRAYHAKEFMDAATINQHLTDASSCL